MAKPSAPATALPSVGGHFAVLANAAVYDVVAAAATVKQDTWLLPRGDVAPVDTFAIWRTLGPEGKRGVVAFGRVLASAEERESPPASRGFWTSPPPAGARTRQFAFEYVSAPNLPLWLGEEGSGVLERLSVGRAQGNKKYTIPDELWTELVALAGGFTAAEPKPTETGLEERLLAGAVPDPVAASPSLVHRPSSFTPDIEELAQRMLQHIREYGSITESQVMGFTGGAKGYRRLRRHLQRTHAPIVGEGTPRGMLWRLADEESS